MGRTRIELLSSGDIDMFDDVPTPLTFAIADIRTPDKRDSHFSKTIKVPGTKGNNIRFGNIFDINQRDGTYNPNRKVPCTLYIDDIPQLNGFLQILSLDIDDKSEIVYNVSIKGNVNNIFQTLGDDLVEQIDLTEFDHTLTRANQKASWTNTYTGGYCYPLIEYGFNTTLNEYKVEHIMPAVFLRTLIDKIFSSAGFTYSSTFFDSTIFKSLIIPCTGEGFKYSDTQVQQRLFSANISTTQIIVPSVTRQLINIDTDINDPANAFNTSLHRWVCPNDGYYNLNANVQMVETVFYGNTILHIVKNGTTSVGSASYPSTGIFTLTTLPVSAAAIFCQVGDYFDVRINSVSGAIGAWNIQTSGTIFFNQVANATLQAGDMVTLTNTLPKKIKQKDLILDIIRMFNLYVEVDKNNSNKLYIEARDDFYSSGTIVDWTYKLDNSKDIEYTPMGDLDFKKLKYSYTDDKDYYNKKYLDDYGGIGYGNRIQEVENDFLNNTRETKIMFSPSPLVGAVGDDKVIPHIYEYSNGIKNKPFNVRLLYNGGVLTTAIPYQYIDVNVSTTTETQYLYAGHLDSVTAPTFDLSFAVPYEVYYNATAYTNSNLYNKYHKKYIDEITDPSSKVITAYFYLNPYDISKLDFRDSFYFEGQYFFLNKIYDYNPIDEQTTKCEFIKIKDGRSFTPYSFVVDGGYTTKILTGFSDNTPLPSRSAAPQLRSNVINTGANNVLGYSLQNSVINGSYNYVNGGNNINLLGSSGNTIYDGLSNVTLINTSGTTVTESNTLFVNGYSITSGTIASLSNGWVTPPYLSSDYYPDSGAWTVDSGDVITNKYITIGKTLTWNVFVTSTSITGSPTGLYIKLPNGYGSNAVTFHNVILVMGGVALITDCIITSNNTTYIQLYKVDGSAFSNGTAAISFSITIEIQ